MILEEKTLYGLRHKKSGKILTLTQTPVEDPEFSDDTIFRLGTHGNIPWYVDTVTKVVQIKDDPPGWYNAGNYERPTHDYKKQELQIVRYTIQIEVF